MPARPVRRHAVRAHLRRVAVGSTSVRNHTRGSAAWQRPDELTAYDFVVVRQGGAYTPTRAEGRTDVNEALRTAHAWMRSMKPIVHTDIVVRARTSPTHYETIFRAAPVLKAGNKTYRWMVLEGPPTAPRVIDIIHEYRGMAFAGTPQYAAIPGEQDDPGPFARASFHEPTEAAGLDALRMWMALHPPKNNGGNAWLFERTVKHGMPARDDRTIVKVKAMPVNGGWAWPSI